MKPQNRPPETSTKGVTRARRASDGRFGTRRRTATTNTRAPIAIGIVQPAGALSAEKPAKATRSRPPVSGPTNAPIGPRDVPESDVPVTRQTRAARTLARMRAPFERVAGLERPQVAGMDEKRGCRRDPDRQQEILDPNDRHFAESYKGCP